MPDFRGREIAELRAGVTAESAQITHLDTERARIVRLITASRERRMVLNGELAETLGRACEALISSVGANFSRTGEFIEKFYAEVLGMGLKLRAEQVPWPAAYRLLQQMGCR